MLNKTDLEVIIGLFPEKDQSEEQSRVFKKLELLHEQMVLQEEFQNRSIDLRKRMDEINKA